MVCMSSPHLSTQRQQKRLRTLESGQVAAASCRSRYLQPPPVNQTELVALTPRAASDEASLEKKSPSLPVASVARNGHPVQFGCQVFLPGFLRWSSPKTHPVGTGSITNHSKPLFKLCKTNNGFIVSSLVVKCPNAFLPNAH